MKAFDEYRRKQFSGLASSFSWTEKLAGGNSDSFDHDEHSQTGILTSGFESHSRLPDQSDQWLWELVSRYSGATVPDSHGVPWHSTVGMMDNVSMLSKNFELGTALRPECQEDSRITAYFPKPGVDSRHPAP